MKSITIFIGSLGGGGAENVCKNVVNYFANKDISVNLVINNLNDNVYLSEIDKRVRVSILGANSMKVLPFKLYKYISKNKIDKTLIFSYEISIILIFLRKLLGLNFEIYSRCINTISYERKYESVFFRKYITHTIIKLFYKKVNFIISQSNNMAMDLINNYGVKSQQVRVINNPLSNKYEVEIDNNIETKKDNYILFVGRLEFQKGISFLLDALNKIKDKDIKLIIIGKGSCKDNILTYTNKLGLNKRVEFIDFTKDTVEYYKRAKLVVLTSYFEGFPNVLIESLACGTPTVSFDCPSGPKEIIINGENGYLVKYLDEDDLVNKINDGLEQEWDSKVIKETAEKYRINNIMLKYKESIFDNEL